MLPIELLKVIFGALSRDNLDALMLVNILFRNIVLRDFAKEPLRHCAALNIHGHESYLLVRSTGNMYHCKENDDFSRRMRLGRVNTMAFLDKDVEENTFDALLPLKGAWRDGHVNTPWKFASLPLFERAFNELLFCKSMHVNIAVQGQLSQPFMSLPSVRECTLLQITHPPSPLTVAEIIEWLNVDARLNEPKRLETNYLALGDNVENLVQQLQTDFIESETARCYAVEVLLEPRDGQPGPFLNKNASEVLIVSYRTGGLLHFVEIKRMPLGEKQ